MSDTSAEPFLDRVFPHLGELSGDGFSKVSWKFQNRPTSEGVGRVGGTTLDVQKTVDRILDVEDYPGNVKFVERNNILEKRSDTDFTYVTRTKVPVIGKVQCALDIADYGERDGFRVVAWAQNDAETDKLPKKDGSRTEYILGAWLIKEDELIYCLSSCPRKKDVGTLKFMGIKAAAEATSGEALKINIQGMIEWSTNS